MARFISLKSLEMSESIFYQEDMFKTFDRFVNDALGETVLGARDFLTSFFQEIGVEYESEDDELLIQVLNKTCLSRKMTTLHDYGIIYLGELAFLDTDQIKLVIVRQLDIIEELEKQGANLMITQRTASEEILQTLSRKRRMRSTENGRNPKRVRIQD
eukprot:UN14725